MVVVRVAGGGAEEGIEFLCGRHGELADDHAGGETDCSDRTDSFTDWLAGWYEAAPRKRKGLTRRATQATNRVQPSSDSANEPESLLRLRRAAVVAVAWLDDVSSRSTDRSARAGAGRSGPRRRG